MLLKIVALFLVFMLVMASVQKLLRRGGRLDGPPGRKAIDKLRCPTCRRIRVSENAAPCDRPDCEYR